MLASIIYNYGKFCDDFKSTLKLGAYNLSFIKSEQPLFFIENDADIPASKNIKGMNHGDINTTIEAIGLTLWKNI